MDDGDYESAIKYLEKLEGRFPYGRYAEQAQLEAAYAYYKSDEPALALAGAERFIRLHPTHPSVDYAYYLKGLVNFHGEQNFINWLFGAKEDLAERDPGHARRVFRLQGIGGTFPQQPLRRGLRQAHGLPVRGSGAARDPRGALLLPARGLRRGRQPLQVRAREPSANAVNGRRPRHPGNGVQKWGWSRCARTRCGFCG